jgi:osmoprotectant transport system substrate-binding protein
MLVTLLLGSLVLAACGDDDDDDEGGGGGGGEPAAGVIERNDANSDVSITVGSKNFAEQRVLGEIYAQGLAAAGYETETQLNFQDEKTALKALEEREIDAYPEYTGTALGSFFGVKSNEIPKDPQQAFDDAKAGFAERGLTAYPPTPFTSSNEVGLTQERAEELGVEKISDLEGKSQDLTLYGTPECRQRNDCLLGLREVYGLEFGEFRPVAPDLRHEVLLNGDADVSIVFTTDPQIDREGFVLLEDDKGMFPPYNSTFVVRDEIADQAGQDLGRVVELVNEGLTAEVMQELNARVELDKKTPEQVAGEYLEEEGLVG